MAGPTSHQPDTRPEHGRSRIGVAQCSVFGAFGSEDNFGGPDADNVGTSKVGFAANIGAAQVTCCANPRREGAMFGRFPGKSPAIDDPTIDVINKLS